MEYCYTLALKGDEPVALIRSGKDILGSSLGATKEIWIADRPESQAVSVAVEWFRDRAKARTKAGDLSQKRKANIREAKKNGATIPSIAKSYGLYESVVKRVVRG